MRNIVRAAILIRKGPRPRTGAPVIVRVIPTYPVTRVDALRVIYAEAAGKKPLPKGTLEVVRVSMGVREFIMGCDTESPDERPRRKVDIGRPFCPC